MKLTQTLLTICLLLLSAQSTFAQSKPVSLSGSTNSGSTSYPGGIAEFKISKQSATPPEVKFGLKDPVLIETKKHWRVLIGLSLDLLPGEYVSYIKGETQDAPGEHRKVLVRQMTYPFVELEESDDTNLNWSLYLEHKSFSDLDFSNTQQPSLPLRFPHKGKWSETFGYKIFQPGRDGLLIPNSISLTTTQLGTVVSPQNAIVSKITEREDGTISVFLDHGRGLYSVITGLNDLTVELGNGIVAGAVIGKLPSPKSEGKGSATKHLIWQTTLNGVYVNPILLTQLKP